jgi:hypothetical protein
VKGHMRWFAGFLITALLIASAPAMAYDTDGLQTPQPAPEGSPQNVALASQHFDTAIDLYRQRKFAEARIEFEASYALSHASDLLHNLSLTTEKLGQLADAIQFEERFLAAKRADLTQSEIDQSDGRLSRLRAKLAGPVGGPMPASEQPRRVPPAAIGLLSGGAALLVAGIGCGAAALSDRDRLYSGVFADERAAIEERGPKLSNAAIGLYVIGGLAAVAGASWAIVHRIRSSRPAVARLELPLQPSALAR